MISDATTIAELAEILRAKGIRKLRLTATHGTVNNEPCIDSIVQVWGSAYRKTDAGRAAGAASLADTRAEAGDLFSLAAALDRAIGSLPDDESDHELALRARKAGAR